MIRSLIKNKTNYFNKTFKKKIKLQPYEIAESEEREQVKREMKERDDNKKSYYL